MNLYTYDPERYDAEILLDRSGAVAPYDTRAMMRIFHVARTTLSDWIGKGKIPVPAEIGRSYSRTTSNEWTREQVIEMLMAGLARSPQDHSDTITHGTVSGYSKEVRRGLSPCTPCQRAKRDATRRSRQRRKVAA